MKVFSFLMIGMFLILFTLKLCGVIALCWWWVVAPLGEPVDGLGTRGFRISLLRSPKVQSKHIKRPLDIHVVNDARMVGKREIPHL